MAKIDLDRIYEIYIQIPEDCKWEDYIEILHSKVSPLIRKLKEKGFIRWFQFLVHECPRETNDVPKDPDNNLCVHIRLELVEGIEPDRLDDTLEKDCHYFPRIKGRKRKAEISVIAGLNGQRTSIPTKIIEEVDAWWLLGELSVWVLAFIEANSFDLSTEQFRQHIYQYNHFFENQLCMQTKVQIMTQLLPILPCNL